MDWLLDLGTDQAPPAEGRDAGTKTITLMLRLG
jgi:hypothetical protein